MQLDITVGYYWISLDIDVCVCVCVYYVPDTLSQSLGPCLCASPSRAWRTHSWEWASSSPPLYTKGVWSINKEAWLILTWHRCNGN